VCSAGSWSTAEKSWRCGSRTELLIIGGAALGGFVIANGLGTVMKVFKNVLSSLKGSKYGKKDYMDLFGLMYDLFNIARKDGVIGLEKEIDEPIKSPVFSKHKLVQKDHHALEFITDYCAMMVSGDMNPFQLENLMDVELTTHHHESEEISGAVNKVSDALPGFGIVAAVLGIVNTMAALGGPVQEIGQKVAGRAGRHLLGILLAYGFVRPYCERIGENGQGRRPVFHHDQDLHHRDGAGLSAANCG